MTPTIHHHHISSFEQSNLHIAAITLKVLINFPWWQRSMWMMAVPKTAILIPLNMSSSWSLLLKFYQCPVSDVLPEWQSLKTLWTFHCLWWHCKYLQSFRSYVSKLKMALQVWSTRCWSLFPMPSHSLHRSLFFILLINMQFFRASSAMWPFFVFTCHIWMCFAPSDLTDWRSVEKMSVGAIHCTRTVLWRQISCL